MTTKVSVIALIKDHAEAYLKLEEKLSEALKVHIEVYTFKNPMTAEQIEQIGKKSPKIVLACVRSKEIRSATREFQRLDLHIADALQLLICCHPHQKLNRSSGFQLFKRLWLSEHKLWLNPADTSTVLAQSLGELLSRLLRDDKLALLEEKAKQIRPLYTSEILALERDSLEKNPELAKLCTNELLRREKNPSMRSGKQSYRR